jgi:hypothetical protein
LYQRQVRGIREPGRPRILSDLQLLELEVFLNDQHTQGLVVTYHVMASEIATRFGIEINTNTLRGILWKATWCKAVQGKVTDARRAACSPDEIVNYYEELGRLLNGTPAGMVFNVDESGFQDWQDAMDRVVLVPADYEGDEYPLPVERQGKRSTAIVAIAADGTCIQPLIVIARKTIEVELRLMGVSRTNCLIVHQDCGFVNAAIFDEWADKIFFPHVLANRNVLQYKCNALLILDACSSHFSDGFMDQRSHQGGILPSVSTPLRSPCVQ